MSLGRCNHTRARHFFRLTHLEVLEYRSQHLQKTVLAFLRTAEGSNTKNSARKDRSLSARSNCPERLDIVFSNVLGLTTCYVPKLTG